MTRKDFVLIADTLRDLPLGHDDQAATVAVFAAALASTNPRFDRQRFIDAATA